MVYFFICSVSPFGAAARLDAPRDGFHGDVALVDQPAPRGVDVGEQKRFVLDGGLRAHEHGAPIFTQRFEIDLADVVSTQGQLDHLVEPGAGQTVLAPALSLMGIRCTYTE